MKKILALICTLIICVSFASVAVNATETETASEVVTEAVETETEAIETTAPETETVEEVETVSPETDAVPIDEVTIDNEKYAQQFIDYVFSGAAGSTELMDKIIEMGEQFSAQKEAGYTFEERIKQLITPENMITTISAAFLLVCGIAVFVFKHWQKRSNMAMHNDITCLRKQYDTETKENQKLKAEVKCLREETKELHELIQILCERSDLSKSDMDHVSHTATAVAKMVKDVFLNSKTIDASGKALLVHNYIEAIGDEGEVKNE